jgi:hypothetical protein
MPTPSKTQLTIPASLSLPSATVEYLDSVSRELSPDDAMYHGNDAHYLSCGASALNVILGVVTIAQALAPRNVLDFGAGAGRVTRWLRAAFPTAAIHTCDLPDADMRFNERVFGARTWTIGTDIGALASPPSSYDLIWIGSVATHLSAQNSERLLDKMLTWTNPGGIVAMSLHGRFVSKSYKRQCEMGCPYIHEQAWTTITALYEETATVSPLLNCHGLQLLLKGGKGSGLSPLLRRFGTIITMSLRCKKWICDFAAESVMARVAERSGRPGTRWPGKRLSRCVAFVASIRAWQTI